MCRAWQPTLTGRVIRQVVGSLFVGLSIMPRSGGGGGALVAAYIPPANELAAGLVAHLVSSPHKVNDLSQQWSVRRHERLHTHPNSCIRSCRGAKWQ